MAHIEGSYPVASEAPATVGWQTMLDVDMAAQAPQTFAADGTYTIAGKTWTKANTVNEAASMNLSAGGLEIRPLGNGTNFGVADLRQTPALTIPLISLFPGLTWQTGVRVWCYVTYDNASADFDNVVTGIHQAGAVPTSASNVASYSVYRGMHSGSLCHFGQMVTGAVTRNNGVPKTLLYNTCDVTMLEVPRLVQPRMILMGGSFSAGWPSEGTLKMNGLNVAEAAESQNGNAGELAWWLLHLTAIRYNSATDYRPRIGRVRVDVKP